MTSKIVYTKRKFDLGGNDTGFIFINSVRLTREQEYEIGGYLVPEDFEFKDAWDLNQLVSMKLEGISSQNLHDIESTIQLK